MAEKLLDCEEVFGEQFVPSRSVERNSKALRRPFVISDVARRQVDGVVEQSALVDGFRLWFRFPRVAEEIRGEPWIAAALLPAMAAGRPLRIADSLSVSPKFLSGVSTIQRVTNAWNPAFQKIALEVDRQATVETSEGTGGFFAGGVDGTFTFLRHLEKLQYVVILNGFDFQSDSATFVRTVERNRRFCTHFGKELLPVETNYYEFGTHHRISRAASFGGLLASIALSLGSRTTYIASSYGYLDLPAQGSHPMLDHLWGTESNWFIHDGAEIARTRKLEIVAQSREALENLHVCWRDPVENCGTCVKCIRTMVSLRLLGHDETRVFPQRLKLSDIGRMPIASECARSFVADNLQLAERVGDRAIATALRRHLWRYDARRLLVDADRILLGGSMQKLRKRLRPIPPEDAADIWPSAKGH